MFCTSCGKQIADGSLFCTSCGARLAPSEQQKASSEPIDTTQADVTEVPAVQETPNTPTQTDEPAPIADAAPAQPKAVTYTPPIVSSSSVVPPKKANNGIFAVIGAAVVIILLIMLLSGGSGGGYSDYKTLVKDYYNAIYKNDYNSVIKMFDKDIQKEMKDYKEDIKDQVSSMKTDWDDQYDKGWNKKVEAAQKMTTGKSHYSVLVRMDDEDFDTLYLKKVNDKYYLDEENSPFY